jgi:hypothetical protein
MIALKKSHEPLAVEFTTAPPNSNRRYKRWEMGQRRPDLGLACLHEEN